MLVFAGCRKDVADNKADADVPLPFTFMPPETAGFLRINVGEMERTPLGKDLWTALFPSTGDEMRLETLTLLFFRQIDLSDNPVLVAMTKMPFARAKVLLMHGKDPLEKAHEGKTYYSYASSYTKRKGSEITERGPEGSGLYFIDDRSFLSSSIDSLHRALEVSSRTPSYRPSASDLSLYSQPAHVVGGFVFTDEVSQGFKGKTYYSYASSYTKRKGSEITERGPEGPWAMRWVPLSSSSPQAASHQ